MSNSIRWLAGRMVAPGLMALALVFACNEPSDSVSGEPGGASYLEQRRECPLPVEIDTSADTTLPSVTEIPVAGKILNVPEFHDCQRFIVDSEGTLVYDSLYAIFASFELDTLWASKRDSLPEDSAFVAAEIVSWGGEYGSLGIKPWFNCLLVFGSPSAPEAKMVSLGPYEHDCLHPPTTTFGTTALVVRRIPPTYSDADYPAVARWEWDAETKRQYIGIKCGPAWCEIFKEGTILNFASTYAGIRVSQIKGWFDEQRLAVGTRTVSNIKGSIFPHPRLDSYTLDDFRKTSWLVFRRWVPTAYVALDGTDPDVGSYLAKTNFDPTVATSPIDMSKLNRIWLCNGSRFQCRIPSNVQCTWPSSGVPGDSLWWTKIQSPGNVLRYKCVWREDHSDLDIHIPGTARWRWLAQDETEWMRCAQGCCQPH